MKEKGFAHVVLLVIAFVGLASGLFLVSQKTNLLSQAFSAKEVFKVFSNQPSASQSADRTINYQLPASPANQSGSGGTFLSAFQRLLQRRTNAPILTPAPSPTALYITPSPVATISPTANPTVNTSPSIQPTTASTAPAPTPTPTPTSTPAPTITPAPTSTPTPAPSKRVFITSTTYTGNLGGLSGADAKCQERANAASLGGDWKAWLSDTVTSASSRLSHNNGAYQLLDGTLVASSWNDLTDGTINHAINLSEYKATVDAGNVWTNTTRSGEINQDIIIQPAHCQNWTDSQQSTRGAIGSTWSGSTDYHWTESGYDYCGPNQTKRLFCFEQ